MLFVFVRWAEQTGRVCAFTFLQWLPNCTGAAIPQACSQMQPVTLKRHSSMEHVQHEIVSALDTQFTGLSMPQRDPVELKALPCVVHACNVVSMQALSALRHQNDVNPCILCVFLFM